MGEIVLKNVTKIYEDGYHAVEEVNLQIKPKEFMILVGPSGCGKSTTLRMIAGLEDISQGEMWFDDKLVNFLEPGEREIAMVFQNYALYPNMTVYKNLAFSLEIRGVDKKEVKKKVEEVAKLLGLQEVLHRRPKALSGGQRQRVAIGNAIIRNPELLLMDEPLSNLDAKLRGQMRVELKKLHESLGNTIIYVTHDQIEAMTLGTRIVVMNHGRIQQVDTPERIYNNPVNQFVAGFIGSPSMNFLPMQVKSRPEHVEISSEWGMFLYPKYMTKWLASWGKHGKVLLGIRPEHFVDEYHLNEIMGDSYEIQVTVKHKELLGNEVLIYFDLGDVNCCARVDAKNNVSAGESIRLWIDLARIHYFDERTGANLLYAYRNQEEKERRERA